MGRGAADAVDGRIAVPGGGRRLPAIVSGVAAIGALALALVGWAIERALETAYPRLVAVWFDLMLRESNGPLDFAVRAYHRGFPLAHRGEGAAYLENVNRLRRRYIRNQDNSPAWDFLFVRARQERLRAADAITREAASDGPAREDSKP